MVRLGPVLQFHLTMMMAMVLPALSSQLGAIDFVFTDLNSSPGNVGWVLAGDMDNDGDLDLVAGGGNHLQVYENDGFASGWQRFGNLDITQSIGANGAVLFDVDGDNDLDVISAKYNNDIGWWENPLEQFGELANGIWPFHMIDTTLDAYMHDILVADLDGDGVAAEFVMNTGRNGYWNTFIIVKWYRPGPDPTAPWESHIIENGGDGLGRYEELPHCHAGIDVGDIDGDNNLDFVFSNGWYEAPDDPTSTWIWHEVTQHYGISNTLAVDMDGDQDLDLLMSAGHHGVGVLWMENVDATAGQWAEHIVDPIVEHPEGLAVQDLDGDGHLEILASELFFEFWTQLVHNLYLYEDDSGSGTWSKVNLVPNGRNSHLFQLADINEDCNIDIIHQTAGDFWVVYMENISNLTPCEQEFRRGDCNVDGTVNIADAIFNLSYQFQMGPSHCLDAHDVNDNGAVNIADVVFQVTHLFGMGSPIPAPFPDCGVDPTADANPLVICENYTVCP